MLEGEMMMRSVHWFDNVQARNRSFRESLSWPRVILVLAALTVAFKLSYASSGEEGASFLDIPVGAAPAAMGSAYSAYAADAYAPTWNAGALGRVESTQVAGQHLSYLESINYEYLSVVHPVAKGRAWGAAAQYLGSGGLAGRSETGADAGEFSSRYAAYTLSYGRLVGEKLSVGLSGKWINAKIEDVGADAFALDIGALYQLRPKLQVAGVLGNVGTKLKFLNEGDSLPLNLKLGCAYHALRQVDLALEGVYRKEGPASAHVGTVWRPISLVALRMGYKTDTLKELGALAGLTAGMGLDVWGHELAYAWSPYGDLGNTHYISFVMRFGEAARAKRNLIRYNTIKSHRAVKRGGEPVSGEAQEYQQLMQLLGEKDKELATRPEGEAAPSRRSR